MNKSTKKLAPLLCQRIPSSLALAMFILKLRLLVCPFASSYGCRFFAFRQLTCLWPFSTVYVPASSVSLCLFDQLVVCLPSTTTTTSTCCFILLVSMKVFATNTLGFVCHFLVQTFEPNCNRVILYRILLCRIVSASVYGLYGQCGEPVFSSTCCDTTCCFSLNTTSIVP